MSQGPKSCKNGKDCMWKKSGKCKYFHKEVGVQKQQEVQVNQLECQIDIGVQKHIGRERNAFDFFDGLKCA